MSILPLTIAPHPIFKQKAIPVDAVTDAIRGLFDDMLETMYSEHGIGLGAPMVGRSESLAVIDLQENGEKKPLFLANPRIVATTAKTQSVEEASLSFPGIAATVIRPHDITVFYLDYEGKSQELQAEGFLAQVIQHEVDYLYGITFLDHLSPTKRDMLLRKMAKHKKFYKPHVHGAHCHHG